MRPITHSYAKQLVPVAGEPVRGADVDVAALWAAVEEVAPRAAVLTAAATVVSLVPEDGDSAETALRAALATRYAMVRPFLSLLGESKALDAASAGKRVLAGVRGPRPAPVPRTAPSPAAEAEEHGPRAKLNPAARGTPRRRR
jgi:hypothetical protein